MFTLKARHASVSNFMNAPNPQTSSKASSRKQPFYQKYQKDSLRQSQRQLESRLSTVLPRIKKSPKVDTANDFFEGKKKQKIHTKDLALAISKYKLHRGQFSKASSSEISFDIMKVLQCFTMVENNFQELFIHMREDLKGLLYLTTNAQLAEKYQVKEGEMYKDIVENIDAAANKKLKQAYEKVRQANDAKEQIEEEYGRFKLLWEEKEKKLNDEIEFLKKLVNNQYLKYLQEKLQQQTERIQQLQISQRSLVQLRDEYEKTMKKQEEQIEQKVKEISRLNTIIYDLKISKQESEKMILKLRDRFDQFNLKMTGIKEMIADVQKENEELKTERVALIKRAAVSFEELTPRPKYKKIMNFTQKEQLLTLKPTVEIAQVMLKKIGNDAFIDDFRRDLFDIKLSHKKQLHPRLEQAQKIRQNTQISIADSKSDLREVEKIFAKESWQ